MNSRRSFFGKLAAAVAAVAMNPFKLASYRKWPCVFDTAKGYPPDGYFISEFKYAAKPLDEYTDIILHIREPKP